MAENPNHTEYLINKFRQLGANTTKWSLLFLLAIVYTWFVSIYPQQAFIYNYITLHNKQVYFDTLASKSKDKKESNIITYREKIKYFDSVINKIKDPVEKNKFQVYKYNKESKLKKSTLYKRQNKLRSLIDSAAILKGREKKRIKKQLKSEFSTTLIFKEYAERQKQLAEREIFLLENSKVEFNIPGVTPAAFYFRAGLICWVILSLFLLLYVFSTRLTMISCLQKIYQIKAKQAKLSDKWIELDLQVPVWIAPITYNNENGRRIFKNLVAWKYKNLNNIIGLCALLIVMIFQLHVLWLLWHISLENEFFKIITVLLTAISVFLFLLWIKPLNITTDFAEREYFSFKRREIVKLGISAFVLLLIVPAIGNAVPQMQGNVMNYKRFKKRSKKYKINIADGFYVRRGHNRKNVIYCFLNGESLSMKYMNEIEMKRLIPKMTKVNIYEYIKKTDSLKYSIPFYAFVLEREALSSALKNDYLSAINLLLFSLNYTPDIHETNLYNKINNTSNFVNSMGLAAKARLAYLLMGLLVRAEAFLKNKDLNELSILTDKTYKVFKGTSFENTIVHNCSNEVFVRKWKSAKNVPWKLS